MHDRVISTAAQDITPMGFDPAKALAGVDLSNKVILITGSTSGIGFATAQILVQFGAKVYLGARNAEKAAACIKRIEDSLSTSAKSDTTQNSSPKGQALFHELDLSDPKDAKRSAEAFIEKEERLDVLINCAAAILVDFTLGPNGVQHLMNVNYFSPFVFTDALLPLLKKTAAEPNSDVRIVNVSSDGHLLIPNGLHFKSIDDFNINYGNGLFQTLKRYGTSKLCEILWTRELQRHLTEEGSDIIVISLHPGSVNTESAAVIGDRSPWPLSSLLRLTARFTFISVLSGAGTPLIAAASPVVRTQADKYRGAYLKPTGKLAKPSKQAQSDELARELWETTETLLKEWGLRG